MAIFRDFSKVFGFGRWGSDANICLRPINGVLDAFRCIMVNSLKIHLLPGQPDPEYTLKLPFFVILARYLGRVTGGVAHIFSLVPWSVR
jgi:hypothetical protein